MEPTNEECEKFLDLIHLLLDNETDRTQEEYLSNHMDDCSPCMKQLELEKEFRDIIRKKIQKKEVPQELITAIRTKIKFLV